MEKKINYRMRIRSEGKGTRHQRMYMELHPKKRRDLEQICDVMFDIKIVDMGNACYTKRHYSDVI